MSLNKEQLTTQISSSHRLIKMTSTMRHNLDMSLGSVNDFDFISFDYFVENILSRIKERCESLASKRVVSVIKSAKINFHSSSNKRVSSYELAAEVLFDSHFFKSTNKFCDREETKLLIESCVKKNGRIIMLLPIMSRKPLSPI